MKPMQVVVGAEREAGSEGDGKTPTHIREREDQGARQK